MSRTEKVHSHKCPGVRYMEASSRARAKAIRSAGKSKIRNMSDPDDLDIVSKGKRTIPLRNCGSVSYLDPRVTEAEFLKSVLSAKQSIANNTLPWPEYNVMSKSLYKDIQNRVKQKDPAFKGDNFQAILALSDEELAECVHRFYASKGLKGNKR